MDPKTYRTQSALSALIPGRRVGGEPASETEHFMECGRCGQMFDMRDLGEVFAHEECPLAKARSAALNARGEA